MSEEITQEEYLALTKAKKPSKLRNVKTESDGYTFDSKAEARRYEELKLELRAGTITDLQVHPVMLLQEGFRDILGRWHRAITYELDFSYYRDGPCIYEDVKGHKTEVFKIKYKLFRYRYPTIPLIITDVSRKGS